MISFDPLQIKPENHTKYPRWKYVAPLPSAQLMGSIGAPDIENFLIVGEAWAQVISKFLTLGDTVFDIGCGCGRTARFLIYFSIEYIGFDIFQPSIQWCIENLTPLSNNRFQFYHFNGISEHYNPQGTINPMEYRFPSDDGYINMAIGASIFTHLTEPHAMHYLEETNRVLKGGGKALFSIHTHPADGKLISGKEDRIDIDPKYFLIMTQKAGLRLKEEIGDLCGQETFLFEK